MVESNKDTKIIELVEDIGLGDFIDVKGNRYSYVDVWGGLGVLKVHEEDFKKYKIIDINKKRILENGKLYVTIQEY